MAPVLVLQRFSSSSGRAGREVEEFHVAGESGGIVPAAGVFQPFSSGGRPGGVVQQHGSLPAEIFSAPCETGGNPDGAGLCGNFPAVEGGKFLFLCSKRKK